MVGPVREHETAVATPQGLMVMAHEMYPATVCQ